MRYGAFEPGDETSDRRAPARKRIPQAVVFAAALTMSTSLGLWVFYSGVAVGHTNTDALAPVDTATAAILARAEALPVTLPPSARPLTFDVAMLEPVSTMSPPPEAYATPAPEAAEAPAAPVVASVAPPAPAETQETAKLETVSAPTAEEQVVPTLSAAPAVVKDVPLPMPRPAFLRSAENDLASGSRRAAQQAVATAAPEAPSAAPAQPSFFDKLFGKPKMPGTVLAYANPEDGIGGQADGGTAVYSIANHTVYLPDGTRLEAHSGLGARLDDPNGVRERMRGATPPALYDLTLRESLFHGVQALRLNPVNEADTFGRGGLLAHTFMLGPRGDSNGCVVFRNYQAFLQAYQAGKIKRLRVVSSL